MAVAAARGTELEREFAFGVVRQLLDPIVSAEPREQLFEGAAALATSVFESGGVPRRRAVVRRVHELPVTLMVATRPDAEPSHLEELRSEPEARVVRPGGRARGLEAAPRQPHGFYGLVAIATLVEALVERARPDEAERELERIGLPERPTAARFAVVLQARGRLRLTQGRPDDALADSSRPAGTCCRHRLRHRVAGCDARVWRLPSWRWATRPRRAVMLPRS